MEITIDKDFKELIAPQTKEENEALEQSILEDGFNNAYPLIVWKGYNILVDGHHRFEICKKHNIEFTIIEQEFDSKEAAINWMVDNQLSRRNIDYKTRQDLLGRKYNLVKKTRGGAKGNTCTLNSANELAAEFNMSPRTVKNAGKYNEHLNKLCETSQISRKDLMENTSIQDINEIVKLDEDKQKEVLDKIMSGTSLREVIKIEKHIMISFSIATENKDHMLQMLGNLTKDQFINYLINAEYGRINI